MATTEAKAECEILLNAGLPLVEKVLLRHGEFLPFAAALRPNREIVYLGAYDGREYRPLFGSDSDLIRALKEALASGARRREYLATALFYDAGVTLPTETERVDAIAVSLDHRDAYSVIVLLPYAIENGKIALDAPFAQAGEAEIFRSD